MNQEIRNKLRNVVTQCRKLLEESITEDLEGKFGIFARNGQVTADPNAPMTHLSDEERTARKDILDHFDHIKARGFKPKDALEQLIREIAFTHLNRFCAYKMMEARDVYVGGQKFREAVSRGVHSNGVKFYLADHPDDERKYNTGRQDVAYRHFLDWLGGLLSDEIGVLFSPNDPANRLYPRQNTLDEVLNLLNTGGIKPDETELREQWPSIWSSDETIGWVYQYFTPKELRDQARKESAAPRNSYELAFRNQFFTPRYVVEFLTDNTLGRIWYEMRKGDTRLKDECGYMVRRHTEIFLEEGEQPPADVTAQGDDLLQEELLRLPLYVSYRSKKDPRDLKILDPASGSGHFLLYCFDLLQIIYEEAYSDPDLGPALQKDYSTIEELRKDVPRLILAKNLHGIDIDLRASQIAALALWLRCQRAYQELGLKRERPAITRSNLVCAEPMPGEEQLRKDFVNNLEPKLLGQVVEEVFKKMKFAGESGSLLKIESEIQNVVASAKQQWVREMTQATDRKGQPLLFTQAVMDRIAGTPERLSLFDLTDVTDDQFFEQAEFKVVDTLRRFAERADGAERFKRKLFIQDTVRGFAFVELCHARFDVVLMNPPFGEASNATFDYFSEHYPDWAENLACVSVIRGYSFLIPNGLLGVFCDRTVSIKSSYENFRRNNLIARIHANCDTGWGVLDANVETTAFVLDATASDPLGLYLNAASQPIPDHPQWIAATVAHSAKGESVPECYSYRSSYFKKLPNAVIGYYFPGFLVSLFNHWPSLKDAGFQARQGHSVVKEQHARVFWEIPRTATVGKDLEYALMYNGGEYSLYWLPLREVTRYGPAAQYLTGNPAVALRNQPHQFQAGIGYGKRGEFLDAHIIPSGVLFSDEGQGITGIKLDDAWVTLAFLNSSLGQFAINQYCGQHKHCGYINLLPLPRLSSKQWNDITKRSKSIVELKRKWYRLDETCLDFAGKTILLDLPTSKSLGEAVPEAIKRYQADEAMHSQLIECNDRSFAEAACHGEQDQKVLKAFETSRPPASLRPDVSGVLANGGAADFLVSELASWTVGCIYGRWDIRLVTSDKSLQASLNAFDPLPPHPLGLLKGTDGAPVAHAPSGYPLRIATDGILVDDVEHQDDIVRRVREVLEVVWRRETELVEKNACEFLGVKELREYYRKPGKGGFWDDHVSRYSKRGRKAPVYWLLQSSKKNYAIWLYYHRLDKDLLFKILVNYVEPKSRLERNRLDALRKQHVAAGSTTKEGKRLARDLERQDEFISELQDFEDKLRQVANLHLLPDLNDGVVLNLAPLHELVQWREAESYWDELLEGKYEWSSIGKQIKRLQQKGLIR
ncbi:MAG: BREX-1 system adenine-specific DNA-methyltransferase PglX [Candidatus Sulfotelmatobacter sp.]